MEDVQFFRHSFHRDIQYLQVKANQVLCLIELERIEKIVSLMALKAVSASPGYLVGVFNYKGRIVPVIDLSLRIGQPVDAQYDINSSVILCETLDSQSMLGLIVSDIKTVLNIKLADLQLSPEFINKKNPFMACYQHLKEIAFVLDSNVLLENSLSNINAVLPEELNNAILQYNESYER